MGLRSSATMGCGSSHFGTLQVNANMKQVMGHKAMSISESIKKNSDVMSVLSRSFSGTATTAPEGTLDWVVGPSLKDKWDDPRRRLLFDWLMKMEWALAFAHDGFAVAGLKQDGTIGGVILVVPHKGIQSDLASTTETIRALWGVGRPPWKGVEDVSAFRRRAFAAQSAVENVKNKYCKGPHAHVKVVAVDPDAQGMGFCGKLMRYVNDWADQQHLPLWLETSGERNVAIYERFGYKTMERYEFRCGEEVHEDEFGMLRA